MALVHVELPAGWSIELEEGYTREAEPDGAVVLWNERETIRAMTVSVGGGPTGEPMSAREISVRSSASRRSYLTEPS